MSPDLSFNQINSYLEDLVPDRNGELQRMESYGHEQNFPIIGPVAGQFCYQLTRMNGARRVFELGSGYGYSTAWFARGVVENGGGDVHHVVWNHDLSNMARAHLDALGYADVIHYHVGEAVEALRSAEGPFDLIFNDIDKQMYPDSIPVILDKLRPGGLLIIDNMLLGGRVLDKDQGQPTESVRGVLETTRLLADEDVWISSLVPIRDGLTVAMKR